MSRAQLTSTVEQNTGGAVSPYVAGKNLCINGGFDIWQRGTSFTITAGVPQYTADRWTNYFNGAGTVTQDTTLVNPGNRYGLRVTATATSVGNTMYQVVETMNVLPMAGKTVTFSVYVAGTTGKAPTVGIDYSTTVDDAFLGTYTTLTATSYSYATTTGSFQRLTATFAIPSTAKTLRLALYANGMSNTDYITWSDAQLEIGSVATPFSRAGGTLSGELAACQRYYERVTSEGSNGFLGAGYNYATTNAVIYMPFKVTKRVVPTAIDGGSSLEVQQYSNASYAASSFAISTQSNTYIGAVTCTTATASANAASLLRGSSSTTAFIGFISEL